MERPCNCNNAVVGNWDETQCRPCWLALNDERYKKLWEIDGKKQFTFSKVTKKPCNCKKKSP